MPPKTQKSHLFRINLQILSAFVKIWSEISGIGWISQVEGVKNSRIELEKNRNQHALSTWLPLGILRCQLLDNSVFCVLDVFPLASNLIKTTRLCGILLSSPRGQKTPFTVKPWRCRAQKMSLECHDFFTWLFCLKLLSYLAFFCFSWAAACKSSTWALEAARCKIVSFCQVMVMWSYEVRNMSFEKSLLGHMCPQKTPPLRGNRCSGQGKISETWSSWKEISSTFSL